MGIIKIAFKNFLRTRKKNKNLTIVIIASFFLVLVLLSFFSTMKQNYWNFWINNFIGGNIVVNNGISDFDIFNPIRPDDYFSESEYLSRNPENLQVSPRLRIGVLLDGTEKVSLIAIGIDIENEKKIGNHINIISGELFDDNENGILIPEELAYNLKIKVNDDVVLVTYTKDGYANYDLFTVKGILEPVRALELTMGSSVICYMPINKVRELIYTDTDDVSEFLAVGNAKAAEGYKLIDGKSSFSVVRLLNTMLSILRIVFILFIMIFVFNIVFQSVLLVVSEREMEFALFLTYGSSNSLMSQLIFFELLFYSIYCSLIGFIASFLFINVFNMMQISPFGTTAQILMATSGQFTINLLSTNVILSLLIITSLILVGSLFPFVSCLKNIRIVDIFSRSKR